MEQALADRDADKKVQRAANEKEELAEANKQSNVQEKELKSLKRPASAMKRPAASSSVKVMERPASAQSMALQTPEKDPVTGKNWKGTITTKERLKRMPEGCSSCRYVPGCCNSWWIKRRWRPV